MQKQIKKAAVDLTDLAIGIVVLGIVVTVGAVILTTTRDARLSDLPVTTTYNETITANNVTPQTLANTWVKGITSVVNATNASQTIPSANYTLTVDGNGVSKLAYSGAAYHSKAVNVTYTKYTTTQADWAVADDAATGIAEYGNWFKIIVIVGVAAVVLSIIFLAFGKRSESTSY